MTGIIITGTQIVTAGAAIVAGGSSLGVMYGAFSIQAKNLYEQRYGAGSSDNSWNYDAFLHAYVNARFSTIIGADVTKAITNSREGIQAMLGEVGNDMDISNNTYASDKYADRDMLPWNETDAALGTEIMDELEDPYGGYVTDPNFELPENFETIDLDEDAMDEMAAQGFSSDVPPPDLGEASVETVFNEAAQFLTDIKERVDTAFGRASPLILDLDHSGTIELISLANSETMWDGDLDGFANASGWVTGGDGFLAYDINENGVIDDNSELFGTADIDGFTVLREYDSNEDGLITAEDAIWEDLIIWIDADEDGYSESAELYTLADHDIISINLNATEVSATNQGHDVTHTSIFTVDTGGGAVNYSVCDVWFQYDTVNSKLTNDFTPDLRVAYLPQFRGYGTLPDLFIAMSMDNSGTGNLLDLVKDFKYTSINDIFTSDSTIVDDVRGILYRWAGVEGLTGDERGDNVDSRELGFLEKLVGDDFVQNGVLSNPLYDAGQDLQEAFHIALNHFYARLVAQSAGGALFTGDWYYNIATDSFDGITGIDADILDDLETEATGLANSGERAVFWQNVIRMVEFSVGIDNLPSGDQTAIEDAVYNSDNTLTLTEILTDLAWANPAGNSYNGTAGADTLTGGSGDDDLNGNAGDDTLNGGAGGDTIDGGAGADSLYGGAGGDVLNGQGDNDTYIYNVGDGDDVITETGGTDTLSFGAGIDSGDLTITRLNNDNLQIAIDNGSFTGNIYVSGQFDSGGGLETILFNDTSTINLTTINYTLNGTAGADSLQGVQYGGGAVDTIYALGGNDTVHAYGGNDVVYGGDGNDKLYGEDDNDTLYGEAGNDNLYGGTGADSLYGGAGDDYTDGGTGNDYYYYGGGHDTCIGGGSDEIILPSGYTSGATVYYKSGSDLTIWFDTNNTITVPSYMSSGMVMTFNGGPTVTLSGVTVIVQGDSGNNTLTGTANADTLFGNGGNDTLTGQNGADFLYGGTGDDDLNGGYGNDWLEGGAGDDRMEGANDNDTYVFTSGIDEIYDISGTEEIRFISGWTYAEMTFSRYVGATNDMVIGINGSNQITVENHFSSGGKIETLRFADNSTVDLASIGYTTYGNSSNNTISGHLHGGNLYDTIYGYGGDDTLNGGNGNDTLYGGDGADDLDGGAGDDLLYGEAGNDALTGGTDNDLLDGGAGNDTMTGNAGNDIYVYTAGLDTITDNGGTDTLRMGSGIDVNAISFSNVSTYHTKITVTASTDELTVNNLRHGTSSNHVDVIEFADGFKTSLPDYASWVIGTTGNDLIAYSTADDTIIAKAGNDTITAGGGNDDVHAGDGDDDVSGQAGNDLLHGGTGNDILYGGDGLDTLYGGEGDDTFVFETASAFNNVDVVKDFSLADDALDISDILSGYDPMTDALTDWVEFTNSGSDTIVKVDRDGDGSTYSLAQIATLTGVTGLTDEAALVTNGNLIIA